MKIGLGFAMAVLLVFAVALAAVISQFRNAGESRGAAAVASVLADVVNDLDRLRERVATHQIDAGSVGTDEIRSAMRRLDDDAAALLHGARSSAIAQLPDGRETAEGFRTAVDLVLPLIDTLDREGATQTIRRQLETPSTRLDALAKAAKGRAATRSAADEEQLLRLLWTFATLGVSIVSLAAGMIVLMMRQNRLISQAHAGVAVLAGDLAAASAELERANVAVEAANRELQGQNRLLVAQEAEARIQNGRFAAALENMREGLSMFDQDARLVVRNGRYIEMYGFSDGEVVAGTSLTEIRSHHVRNGHVAGEGAAASFEVDIPTVSHTMLCTLPDGRIYEIHRQPLPEGGWVATHEDITERRRAEAELGFLARHDGLTGLANRADFIDRLARACAEAGELDQLAVVSFDLDRFKRVNDLHGHGAGDAVLCEVARRAERIVGDRGFVARFGGDEFTIALVPAGDETEVAAIVADLVAAVGEPFVVGGSLLDVGTSAGIALAPRHGRDAETLVRRADRALYEAKANGRRGFRTYDFRMDERIEARRALEADLGQALGEDRLEIRYQPIADLETGRVVAAEALLRWHHPRFGWVSPDVFIPIAEESGLIVPIGEWVLRRACHEAAGWPEECCLSVNLSAAQLRSSGLVSIVVQALAASGLDAHRLELEMTETILFDESAALDIMGQLRRLGVRFSLDDFGTGYSSLSYLRRYEFDQIKIDKSFLRGSAAQPSREAIVNAIGALGRSLGIDTVAEGIETPEELALVRAAGCRYGQGFLLGRPMTASDVAQRVGGDAPPRSREAPGRARAQAPSSPGPRRHSAAG